MQIDSATTGMTKVSAHWSGTVKGVSLTRVTDGSGANSAASTTTWVDARMSIAANGTHEINQAHTFTVTVEKDTGNGAGFGPAASEVLSYSVGATNGAVTSNSSTCTSPGTDAGGQCTITVNSSHAGQANVGAQENISVAGSPSFFISTLGPATATWVDATIQESPATQTNQVNTTTPVSGHVDVDDGTGIPGNAPNGTTISFSLTNAGGATAAFVGPSSCTTAGGTGTCSISINSPTLGSTTIHASTSITVSTIPLSRATGDNISTDGANVQAVWVDTIPPVTTIVLSPSTPDVNGWYVFSVKPSISATDIGTGVAETRCVLDPLVAPATFDDLPATPMCPYLGLGQYVLTEGVHTLWAASKDNAGTKETPVKIVFKIDKTPPTSSITSLAQFQGAGSFPVAWSGTDNLSGVANYDVRYRQAASNGTFGSYTTWFTHTTSTGATFTAPAGTTTCFSVRATDVAGWTASSWSAEKCTTVPLDDPALGRIGLWTTVTGTGYYGPGVARSGGAGNELTQSMRGQTIGVLVTKQPGGGQIQLRWNGSTMLTASLSAASVQKQQLLTFTLPGVQTGTLEIVQTGFGTTDVDGAGAYKTS